VPKKRSGNLRVGVTRQPGTPAGRSQMKSAIQRINSSGTAPTRKLARASKQRITEDSPLWNAKTMGNGLSGGSFSQRKEVGQRSHRPIISSGIPDRKALQGPGRKSTRQSISDFNKKTNKGR
jgi:hypothetical protein